MNAGGLGLNTEECVVSAWLCSVVRRMQRYEGNSVFAREGTIHLSRGLCFVIASGWGPEPRVLLN